MPGSGRWPQYFAKLLNISFVESRLEDVVNQCRRFLTIIGDGGLHHALDAVAAQSAVMADTFDFQQAPIDPQLFSAFSKTTRVQLHGFSIRFLESRLHLSP